LETSKKKVGNRTFYVMWNFVEIETLDQNFSAQICLFCSFSFLFSLFNT